MFFILSCNKGEEKTEGATLQQETVDQVAASMTANTVQYKVDITDGIIAFSDAKVYRIKGTQVYKKTKREKTVFAVNDDMYSVTGKRAITSDKGIINGKIVEPLISDLSCRDITEGKIAFKLDTGAPILDFGNGECDKKATVQIDASRYPVDFPF